MALPLGSKRPLELHDGPRMADCSATGNVGGGHQSVDHSVRGGGNTNAVYAAGAKRMCRHAADAERSVAAMPPAGVRLVRLARVPSSFDGRGVEKTQATHGEPDDTELESIMAWPLANPPETSPAVSPVDEMTDRLDTIAQFTNLKDETEIAAAPRCAFRPRPHRGEELRDELAHMCAKQIQERAQLYAESARFDDYLHSVQHGHLDPHHRRKVFEWNLEVRHSRSAPSTISAATICVRQFPDELRSSSDGGPRPPPLEPRPASSVQLLRPVPVPHGVR